MKVIRTLLLAGVSVAALGTMAHATDFYVQPITPGPVTGAPLGAVNMQATTDADQDPAADDTAADPADPDAATDPVVSVQRTAGKWLSAAGTGDLPTTTTPPPVTPSSPPTIAPITQVQAATASTTYPNFDALMKAGVVKSGDRIFLMAGHHGQLMMRSENFASDVTVAAAPGQVARVTGITVYDSTHIVFRDLKVWDNVGNGSTVGLIRTFGATSDILFTNLDVRSVDISPNYMSWTLSDWLNNGRLAFDTDGQRISVVGNRLTGVRRGIFMQADFGLVENNVIDGFAGDAMRALGDNTMVRGNKVQNCFKVDGTHVDGLQSFSRGPNGNIGAGTVYRITIENNKIYEWNTPATNPLRCALQGIGMFDGFYDGFIIRNNVISVSKYHGIAMAGALNTVITQNTVVNPSGQTGGAPWIAISYHRSGAPSHDVTVANNVVNSLHVTADAARKVVATNNTVVSNFMTEFVSPSGRDYRLLPTAKAANAGAMANATPLDILGVARPKGKGPDAGAFESQ